MDRRTFLTTSAAGLAGALRSAGAEPRPRVGSDVGPLRRVLVHEPGLAAWWPIPEEDAARAVLFEDERYTEEAAHQMWAEAKAQHGRLVELLKLADVEVLSFEPVLDQAIARCRAAGRLGEWVLQTLPALEGDEDQITAAFLVESAPYPITVELEQEPEPIPLRWIFYTRDIGAMTPRGLVLSRFSNEDRMPEPALLRLALDWSPELRPLRVVFDAAKAQVRLQGGDMAVADETTLFLGVGSLTDAAAGPKLARALGMDVITVQLPGEVVGGRWYRLRKLFLHLDSVFGLLDRRLAVTLPYVFEAKYAEREPLHKLTIAYRKLPGSDRIDYRRLSRLLRDVGRVQVYKAGTGARDARFDGLKLVDYLRQTGYRPIFVGGEPPPAVDPDFLRERVFPEHRNQAANVVAVGPGSVLAYAGNEHTFRALRAAGVEVRTFPGSALARWFGGPHCLTLPLERS